MSKLSEAQRRTLTAVNKDERVRPMTRPTEQAVERAAREMCRCCEGRRIVLTATGERRPCSRCRVDDFEAWLRGRAMIEAARTNTESEK